MGQPARRRPPAPAAAEGRVRWWTTWLAATCAASVAGWATVAYGRWIFAWSDAPGRYAEGMLFLFAHMCFAAVALVCLATAALDFDRKRFGRTDAVMLTLGCSHTGYVAAIFLIPALSG